MDSHGLFARRRSHGRSELAVALQFALEQLIPGRRPKLAALRRWAKAELISGGLLERACHQMGFDDIDDVVPASCRDAYIVRLAEAIAERIHLGDEAPALRIAPEPLPTKAFPAPRLAVVFDAPEVLLQDTLEALACDAAPHGASVIGLRADWLADGAAASRALVVDESHAAVDVLFAEPLPLDAALILHLAGDELASHERLSALLDSYALRQLNHWGGARRLDDKTATHAAWQAAGLPTPRHWLARRGESPTSAMTAALSLGCPLFVLPNSATEGRGVGYIPGPDASALSREIARVHDTADALIRAEERREGATVVRVNVAHDAAQWHAESGFAMVASEEAYPIAARSRGGRIVSLATALHALNVDSNGPLRRLCVAAARALAGDLPPEHRPHLMGLDLLPEVGQDGHVDWLLLEANARPAGLNHSTRLPADDASAFPLGVTSALFRALA